MMSIGLLISSMLFFSCNNTFEEISGSVDYTRYPSSTAQNIEIVKTDSGKIKVKIFAPIHEGFSIEGESPYKEFKKGLRVLTYSEYPEISSSLTCDYAIHLEDSNKWEARDNVVVINIDGDTILTEQMFWDNETHQIYSDKFVNIRSATQILYGRGFTAKDDGTGWKINNIKGDFYLEE